MESEACGQAALTPERADPDTTPVREQERGGDVLVAFEKGLGRHRGRCRPGLTREQCQDPPLQN